MNESQLSTYIRNFFRHHNHVAEKIEAGSNAGLPDLIIQGTKFNFWLEVKYISALPTKETSNAFSKSGHGFTPIQKKKAEEFVSRGVTVYGLIGVGATKKEREYYYLLPKDWGYKISKKDFLEKAIKCELNTIGG